MPNQPISTTPNAKQLCDLIVAELEETKAEAITVLDVRTMTDVTDYMVGCNGSSERHVQAIARNMADALAQLGIKPIGLEGEEQRDWILVDYVDVVTHVMKRESREYYDLESLWNTDYFDQKKNQEA